MPLLERSLQLDFSRSPTRLRRRLLADAEARGQRFRQRRGATAPIGFHNSAFDLLDQCFEQLARLGCRGRLCEWGAGLGVVSIIAAEHGFEAWGVEADGELVEESRRLGEAWGSAARFRRGSFLPVGATRLIDELDDLSRSELQAGDVYDEIGTIDRFDLIYAYPWPDERRFFDELFDTYARPGAMFLSFHGSDEFRLQEKVV